MNVKKELFYFLEKNIPCYKEKKYLLAVSGGLDSMVLLHSMAKIISSQKLLCAHFNHDIRGEESLRDERFVINEAKKLDIKTVVGKRKSPLVSEEFLRIERYKFLEEVLINYSLDYIVLAHHLTDQLETFFMRLVRGTGLYGLRLIPAIRKNILRPFLNLTKEQLKEYARENNIKYLNDSSNFNNQYFRNRVRNKLIPKIEEVSLSYGSMLKFYKRFNSLISEIIDSTDYLISELDKIYKLLCIETCFWIKLKRDSFLKLSHFFQAELLRKISKNLGNPHVTRKEVEGLLEVISRGIRRHNFSGKLECIYSCDWLFFLNESQKQSLKEGLEINRNKNWIEYKGATSIVISVKHLESFEPRFFKPGDRFNDKKLKECFLKKRIPLPERSILPVFAKPKSNEIIWYYGLKSEFIHIKKSEFPFSIEST